MKKFLYSSLSALTVNFCIVFSAGPAQAQVTNDLRSKMTVPDSAHIQIVTLRDGSTIFGRIVVVNADTATFQTEAGSMQIAAGSIREIKEIETSNVHEGSYWFPNPNSTRLFFAPTGQMLKKGEGYVSDYELFFPGIDRKSTRLNSSHERLSRMPSSA